LGESESDLLELKFLVVGDRGRKIVPEEARPPGSAIPGADSIARQDSLKLVVSNSVTMIQKSIEGALTILDLQVSKALMRAFIETESKHLPHNSPSKSHRP
jgi:hypothetical protein